jgi:hypothetical protein
MLRKLLIVSVAGLAWWGLATLAYELMSLTTPKCPDDESMRLQFLGIA